MIRAAETLASGILRCSHKCPKIEVQHHCRLSSRQSCRRGASLQPSAVAVVDRFFRRFGGPAHHCAGDVPRVLRLARCWRRGCLWGAGRGARQQSRRSPPGRRRPRAAGTVRVRGAALPVVYSRLPRRAESARARFGSDRRSATVRPVSHRSGPENSGPRIFCSNEQDLTCTPLLTCVRC